MEAPQSSGTAKNKKNRKNKNRNKFKQGQQSEDGAQGRRPHAAPAAPGGVSKPRLKKQKQQKQLEPEQEEAAAPVQAPTQPPSQLFWAKGKAGSSKGSKGAGGGSGSLLEKMRQRLQGGRFRWLNEKLYTCEGSEALDLMRQEPELYTQYHEGFREQTKGWPVQPVDVAIRWLRTRPPGWAVADLGCGDARLAASVPQRSVRSFDLVATAPGVEACNLASLPLPPASLDAAVFCLSLMGTDYGQFVEEAARVLRPGGWLWVAEVQSRFVDETGHNVIDSFVAVVKGLGLELKHKDLKNPYFFTLQFQKQQQAEGQKQQQRQQKPQWPALRACQYKKR